MSIRSVFFLIRSANSLIDFILAKSNFSLKMFSLLESSIIFFAANSDVFKSREAIIIEAPLRKKV